MLSTSGRRRRQLKIEKKKKKKRASLLRRREEEKKTEEMCQELQRSIRVLRDQSKEEKVKLPKLVISPFTDTHTDFFRFWNQFETQIDKSNYIVTKLSYLNKMLVPKVQLLIKGLLYNSEGYERAKSILKSTYGKPSELANAHIHNILNFPVLLASNPVKIHDFYEKVITSVPSLDTMGKLKESNRYVRSTLDKIPGIRADLVRLDNNWQEWKFGQFAEALRQWTERNPIIHERRPLEDQNG